MRRRACLSDTSATVHVAPVTAHLYTLTFRQEDRQERQINFSVLPSMKLAVAISLIAGAAAFTTSTPRAFSNVKSVGFSRVSSVEPIINT